MNEYDTVDATRYSMGIDHGVSGGSAVSLFILRGGRSLHIRSWIDFDRSPATMQRARKRQRRRTSRGRRGF